MLISTMKKKNKLSGASSSRQLYMPSSALRVCALVLAFAALWLAFDAAPSMAKRRKPPTSKTVIGQVFDAADNPVVGAAVEMTDLTTGKTTAIYTGAEGHFTFTDLKLTEDYQFKAHYKGQSSEVRKVSSWDTRFDLVLNLQIPAPKK
jgi:Carboxypeptidase regulatory-like domain